VFEGHRCLTPYSHYCRSRGQTEKCCVPTWYQNPNDYEENESEESTNEEEEKFSDANANRKVSIKHTAEVMVNADDQLSDDSEEHDNSIEPDNSPKLLIQTVPISVVNK
jgi:hypothetical protein